MESGFGVHRLDTNKFAEGGKNNDPSELDSI